MRRFFKVLLMMVSVLAAILTILMKIGEKIAPSLEPNLMYKMGQASWGQVLFIAGSLVLLAIGSWWSFLIDSRQNYRKNHHGRLR